MEYRANLRNATIFFEDPRLGFNAFERFFVRAVASFAYALLGAASIAFFLSDVRVVTAAGMFIGLFLLDRLVHVSRSRRSLNTFSGGTVNAADFFSQEALYAVFRAFHGANIRDVDFSLLLFFMLSKRQDVRRALVRLDVPLQAFDASLEKALSASKRGSSKDQVQEIARLAFEEAFSKDASQVTPVDLFVGLACAKQKETVHVFSEFEVHDDDLRSALALGNFVSVRRRKTLSEFLGEPHRMRHRVMNRAWSSRMTSALDSVSRDLTDLAREGAIGFLEGHKKEYQALLDALAKPGKENVMLVGDVGVGKGAMVEALARDIVRDRVPDSLFDHRLVELSIGRLVAGADEAEVEERVKKIVDEIESAGNVVLYIPDIENLVRTSGGREMSAADILLPALERESFALIGACPPREFKKYLEPISDVFGAFEIIHVNEVSPVEAASLLAKESMIIERNTGATATFRAVRKAVELGKRYLKPKPLPGSARELLYEAFAYVTSAKRGVVTPEDVAAVLERRINIPLHEAEGKEAAKLLDLERYIHERFVDQAEAVRAVARAVREYRSGLTRSGGPIASFLFVGPTGVGKTELAKILTAIQFGDERFMLRFDMSEFQSKEAIVRFIGSPEGDVRGALTDGVIEKPYSLILLDEFEKTHPDLLNLFLQVMDDARLTDGLGRTVDFSNTIIIATSNAHSDFVKEEIEKGTSIALISEQLKRKLTSFFRPELLNRFSATIVFKPLAREDLAEVVKLETKKLSMLLLESHGIDLQFTEQALARIGELGYDPSFGARPLRGVISDRIRAVLAEKLLRNELKRGDSITVETAGDEFVFTVQSSNS